MLHNFQRAWDKSTFFTYNDPDFSKKQGAGLFSKIINAFTKTGPERSGIDDFRPETIIHRAIPQEENFQFVRGLAETMFNKKAESTTTFKGVTGKKLTDKNVQITSATYEAKLVYVPVYIGAYMCEGQSDEFLIIINGVSGVCEGERPYSTLANTIRNLFSAITKKELTFDDL